MFDTHNTLSTSGAKLLSIRNVGSEYLYLAHNGILGLGYNTNKILLTPSSTGLEIGIGGALSTWNIGSSYIRNTTNDSSFLYNITASAGTVTVGPSYTDLNTGLGTAGADILSFIAGGNEVSRNTSTTLQIKSGASTTFATVGGILKDFYTDASTSGTGETDLYSYTLPANVLATNGDKIVFNVKLDVHNQPTTAYIKFYFGGASLTVLNGVTIDEYGMCVFEIIRKSSSTCELNGYIIGNYLVSVLYAASQLTSQNFAATNVIKITGQCATQAIVATSGYIEYKPAAIN
jgi:hypothetical protein